MKFALLAVVTFIIFNQAFACIGEAQLIGKVKSVKKTQISCSVFLTTNSQINLSMVCPLDDASLFQNGIMVDLVDGHDCPFIVGDSISGILVDDGINIRLEGH